MLELGYDQGGRVASITAPEGVTTNTFDPETGQLESIQRTGGETLTLGYDGHLVTSVAWSGSVAGSVSREYDTDFRVASEQVNAGPSVDLAYDDDGLETQVGALTVMRDPASGLITGTQLGGVTETYARNDYGEVTRHIARFGEEVLFDVEYQYDDLGRIERKIETTNGRTLDIEYGYNRVGYLTGAVANGEGSITYDYDANGNRILGGLGAASYNARDQLLSYGGTSYTYTPNGELQTATGPAGTVSYEHDSRGRVVRVIRPDGVNVRLIHDAAGHRVGKEVDGVVVQRRLYGQNLEVLADLDATGAVVARYVFLSPWGAAAYMEKAGQRYRIISDHLGSARLVVNADTGVVAQRLEFDAWGEILEDTNPGFQPFAFTGREWDPETGLYYYRARYYDPKIGRFISGDPIGFLGGANQYRYVGNNPLAGWDPFGLTDLNYVVGEGRKGADSIVTDDTLLTVAGHANPQVMENKITGARYSAADLAAKILGTNKWKRGKVGKVRLYACRTAEGDESLAQLLADKLRVEVEGLRPLLWRGMDPGLRRVAGKMNFHDDPGQFAPYESSEWVTKHPRSVSGEVPTNVVPPFLGIQ